MPTGIPPEPTGRGPRDAPPSWAGAPGFTPLPDTGMPHAPMPGAPPYPPDVAPPPVAPAPPRRPGHGRAFAAAGVWAAVNLVVAFLVAGLPRLAELGLFVLALAPATVLTALAVGLLARRRAWSFRLLLLVAAPVFWTLRALQNLVLG